MYYGACMLFSLKALSHVAPLRDYFLREENYRHIKRPPGDQMFLLVQRFGELLRKLWNPRNFKAHVSPHEMLQAVVLLSKKRFQITQQGLCQSAWSTRSVSECMVHKVCVRVHGLRGLCQSAWSTRSVSECMVHNVCVRVHGLQGLCQSTWSTRSVSECMVYKVCVRVHGLQGLSEYMVYKVCVRMHGPHG